MDRASPPPGARPARALRPERAPSPPAEPLVRNALAPVVPLIAMELTGLAWLAVEGLSSRTVNVVLLALALSAEKTARFPAVNAARMSVADAASRTDIANIVA